MGEEITTQPLFRQKMEKEPGYKDRKSAYTNYRKGKTHTKARKNRKGDKANQGQMAKCKQRRQLEIFRLVAPVNRKGNA